MDSRERSVARRIGRHRCVFSRDRNCREIPEIHAGMSKADCFSAGGYNNSWQTCNLPCAVFMAGTESFRAAFGPTFLSPAADEFHRRD